MLLKTIKFTIPRKKSAEASVRYFLYYRKDNYNSAKKELNLQVECLKESETLSQAESKVSDFQHECVLTIELPRY